MTEENLAMTVAADPQLATNFVSRTKQGAWDIPQNYDPEFADVLNTNISLLPTINSPEDYKTLMQAIYSVRGCKQRVSVMRHHLKGLHYKWSNLHRQALKFLETKYYSQLNGVRAETKKSIILNALEPIATGVDELDYLLDNAERTLKHLDDLNWAVKYSIDLVTNYFTALRTITPREL